LLGEVEAAGLCAHPVHLAGLKVDSGTGEIKPFQLRVACKDRRAVLCPACSYLYKADAWVLASAGLIGGKGVGEEVGTHPRLFVTLTAPGFGRVHTQRDTGGCNPGSRNFCVHGRAMSCSTTHADDDPVLGSPLCVDCFDVEGAVLWNASASRLWNHTITRLRQSLGSARGLSGRAFRRECCVTYLKVAEFQRRGLAHFHVVIRADGSGGPDTRAPGWVTAPLVAERLAHLAATVSVTDATMRRHSWGRQLVIKELDGPDDNAVAAYVAKYATKTTDGSIAFARSFRSRRAIEHAAAPEHLRRMALTAWDLDHDPRLRGLRLRLHAQALGFTGQLVTKSRSYSMTFGALRSARSEFRAQRAGEAPTILSAAYAGRGYHDPRAERLAVLLHEQSVLARKEARDSRRSRSDSREESRLDSHDSTGTSSEE
jgi:hypothetical protein